MQFLSGKKTYIVAALLFLVGVINVLTGDASGWAQVQENAEILLGAVGLATLRAGVAKAA